MRVLSGYIDQVRDCFPHRCIQRSHLAIRGHGTRAVRQNDQMKRPSGQNRSWAFRHVGLSSSGQSSSGPMADASEKWTGMRVLLGCTMSIWRSSRGDRTRSGDLGRRVHRRN